LGGVKRNKREFSQPFNSQSKGGRRNTLWAGAKRPLLWRAKTERQIGARQPRESEKKCERSKSEKLRAENK